MVVSLVLVLAQIAGIKENRHFVTGSDAGTCAGPNVVGGSGGGGEGGESGEGGSAGTAVVVVWTNIDVALDKFFGRFAFDVWIGFCNEPGHGIKVISLARHGQSAGQEKGSHEKKKLHCVGRRSGFGTKVEHRGLQLGDKWSCEVKNANMWDVEGYK